MQRKQKIKIVALVNIIFVGLLSPMVIADFIITTDFDPFDILLTLYYIGAILAEVLLRISFRTYGRSFLFTFPLSWLICTVPTAALSLLFAPEVLPGDKIMFLGGGFLLFVLPMCLFSTVLSIILCKVIWR